MWISPILATQRSVIEQALQHNNELYSVGAACVDMTKLAGDAQSVYGLQGRLVASSSGYLMLEVPNALVRGAFDALHEPGIELPDERTCIAVMTPTELKSIGTADSVSERGHSFKWQIGAIKTDTSNKSGIARTWFACVNSPELAKLRRSYGLSSTPQDGFRLVIALRRNNVLNSNTVSKTASENQHILITGHCLHGDTPIFDPVTRTTIAVSERERAGKQFHVLSRDEDGTCVVAVANPPHKFQLQSMLEFTFDNGNKITVTPGHRFWAGYAYVEARHIYALWHKGVPYYLPTISEPDLLAQTPDARHLKQTIEGSLADCSVGPCPCDEQLLLAVDNDQDALPSPTDALQRDRLLSHTDALVCADTSKHRTRYARLSRNRSGYLSLLCCGLEHLQLEGASLCSDDLCETARPRQSTQSRLCTAEPHYEPHRPSTFLVETLLPPVKGHSGQHSTRVTRVRPVESAPYFDFHVPEYGNYWACGVWSHNSGSGKTELAKKLHHETGMPMYSIDKDPEWKHNKTKDDPDCYEPGTPAAMRFQAERMRMVEKALSKKKPHIIEGTQLLVAPEKLTSHKVIIVDPPAETIVEQRIHRDFEQGKMQEHTVQARVAKAEDLIRGLEPQMEKLRTNPEVIRHHSDPIPYLGHIDKSGGDGSNATPDGARFEGTPSLVPDTGGQPDKLVEPACYNHDHSNEPEPDPTRPPYSPTVPFLAGSEKAAAMGVLIRAITVRFDAEKSDKKIPLDMIGHYEPEDKVDRSAFGYLDPKGDKDKFAQCASCRKWTGSPKNRCCLLGKNDEVKGTMSCTYYMHGEPDPKEEPKGIFTPEQVGLVNHSVRCENCCFFDDDEKYCELYKHLKKERPHTFDMDEKVDPKGCCNFQTPRGKKAKEHAKKAAYHWLEDQFSIEKAAMAARVEIRITAPEKRADISTTLADTVNQTSQYMHNNPSLLKRLGMGALGAAGLFGAAKVLHTGWTRPGKSLLDMGHQLWTEPENKQRLSGAFTNPGDAEQIFDLAQKDKGRFQNMLLGKPIAGVNPELQKRVHDITYGEALPRMKSQPGDIMLSGADQSGLYQKAQRFTIGSSITHADIGTPSGNWVGNWGMVAKDRWKLKPYWREKLKGQLSTLRLWNWDQPYPNNRFGVGLRPRQEFGGGGTIDPKQFNQWLKKNEHPFSNARVGALTMREIFPELHGDPMKEDMVPAEETAATSEANAAIDERMSHGTQKDRYKTLRDAGYTPTQAAEACSTFAVKTLQKFNPNLIPGNYAKYSPMALMKLTDPGRSYRIHRIDLPENLRTSKALRQEHRHVKWGPIAWRLPIAAALGLGGAWAGSRALDAGTRNHIADKLRDMLKTSADHSRSIVSVKNRGGECEICPHCGQRIEEKDLYCDAKGWTFHRPCFRKGKGAIKKAYSGALGSDAVSGTNATEPRKSEQMEQRLDAENMDQYDRDPDPKEFDLASVHGTPEHGLFAIMAGEDEQPESANPPEIDSNMQTPQVGGTYQQSSALGAQGRTTRPSNSGADRGQSSGASLGGAAPLSKPDLSDLGDMSVDLDSSTIQTGQVPHLTGPGAFAP